MEHSPFCLHSFLLSVSTIKVTDFIVQVNIFGTKYGSITKILVIEGIVFWLIFNANSNLHTFAFTFPSTSTLAFMCTSTFTFISRATFAVMWTYTCTCNHPALIFVIWQSCKCCEYPPSCNKPIGLPNPCFPAWFPYPPLSDYWVLVKTSLLTWLPHPPFLRPLGLI